jgi:hypothetical protein
MKLKITNIIAIGLAVFFLICLLYPWSKKNYIETFYSENNKFISLYDYIMESRNFSIDIEKKAEQLKEDLDKNGTVSIDDYHKLLDEVKEAVKNHDKPFVGTYLINQNLRNDKINKLVTEINDIESKVNSIKDIKTIEDTNKLQNSSIKAVKSGINLNTIKLDTNSPPNQLMIIANNGCLTYDYDNTKKEANYYIDHCEKTNEKQKFNYNVVDSADKFKKHLETLDYVEETDEPFKTFNFITPVGSDKKCLQISFDGLSIEECKGLIENDEQKWIYSETPRTC